MVCIYCGNKTKVGNSRSSKKTLSTWRRRECLGCGAIFTTREQIELAGSLRVKHLDGSLEPFSRDKLFLSVHDSLSHRKTATEDAGAVTDTILGRVNDLQTGGSIELSGIKEIILDVLIHFDNSSSVHYKAHYC